MIAGSLHASERDVGRRFGVRQYVSFATLGSGSRLFAVGAQVAVLALLSRAMSKPEFGNLMIAFSVYRVLSIGIGGGLGSVIVYHVSRCPEEDITVRRHRFTAMLGAVIALVCAATVVFLADSLAAFAGKPTLGPWLVDLAPFLFFSVLMTIAAAALDAQLRAGEAILVSEVAPNAVRLVLLGAGILLGWPATTIAHVFTLSVALPWLCTFARLVRAPTRGVTWWTRWDMQYGGKLTLYTLLSNQLQGVDVLVVGALFAASTVADYAIAARIAAFYPFFQQLLLRQLTPRAGYLLERRDLGTLDRELTVCRDLSIASVGITACMLLLAAPFVLPLFGDYTGAAPLLAWLAMPAFVRAFFLGGDRVIQAAGKAGISLSIMMGSFALVVLTPFVTSRWFGVAAMPVGMILSATILNSLTAVISWRLWQIRLIRRDDAALLVSGCAVFLLYALVPPVDAEWVKAGWLVVFVAWLIRKQVRAGVAVHT